MSQRDAFLVVLECGLILYIACSTSICVPVLDGHILQFGFVLAVSTLMIQIIILVVKLFVIVASGGGAEGS